MYKSIILLTTLIVILTVGVQTVIGQIPAQTCKPITPSNASSLKPIQTIKLPDAVAERWSADSKTFAVATSSEIHLFDTNNFSSKEVSPAHGEPIVNATFNSDDSLVAFGTNDINLLDLVSGQQRTLSNLSSALGNNRIATLSFNSDASQLAAGDDHGNIYIWNPISDKPINRIHIDTKYAGSGLFYNADSSRLISFSVHAVAILDAKTFQLIEIYDTSDMLAPPVITQVSLSPDESILVVLLIFSRDAITGLMFLSEGFVNDLVVSGITHYNDGNSFALSPDGNLMADSVKNEVYIDQLDPQTSLALNQPALVVLEGQPSPPKSISFSPDMHYLASMSQSTGADPAIHDDGTMIIWGVCGS